MKLAFSTNAYTRFSLIEALRGIKAAGYAGVEILADVPHAWPEAIDDRMVGEVAGELDRLGLEVSNINANCSFGYWKDAPPEAYFEPGLISPNRKHREDRQRLILATMEFAKGVGARNISITSGRMLGGMDPTKSARQFAESIRPILDRAEAAGLDIGIECEPGLFLEYVAELVEWIEKLGSPRLGANLDVGHSQVIGESVPEVVRMLKGRIWNLHVEDIPGRKHYHMIPGEGTMDWPALKSALQGIAYNRFLTVELYTQTEEPQRAAEKSFQFLSKHFPTGR
jgi:protein FrlC